MTLAHSISSSRSASLLGSLAFGLALFAGVPGCSDDTGVTPTVEGGAGAGSSGAAGSAGGTAGAAGSGSDTDAAGLCPHFQMSSELADHCVADGGAMIKHPATTCPTTPGDAAGTGDGGEEEYPGALSGTTAGDDECKYNVSYGTACEAGGLSTFNVTLKSRTEVDADGGAKGMTGANPSIEASFEDDPTHLLPNNPKPVMTELGNGDYKIAGVPLDKEGAWVVRFHFFEQCLETDENTKHGHVAFRVFYR